MSAMWETRMADTGPTPPASQDKIFLLLFLQKKKLLNLWLSRR
jgi:hypothetical protein